MNIKPLGVLLLIVVVIFGGIYSADAVGIWQTESTKEPLKFSEGQFEGQPMPDDIRGSYSFEDIENAFDVEASIIAKAFNIDTDSPETIKAKDIETLYGHVDEDIKIGTGALKMFVALYRGLPYEGEDYLPMTAVDVLKDELKWTDEISARLEGFILDIGDQKVLADEDLVSDETSVEDEHEGEIKINGKSTVADAIAYGISLEVIEDLVGGEIENKNMLIRDVCVENSVSFSAIKDQLNDQLGQ